MPVLNRIHPTTFRRTTINRDLASRLLTSPPTEEQCKRDNNEITSRTAENERTKMRNHVLTSICAIGFAFSVQADLIDPLKYVYTSKNANPDTELAFFQSTLNDATLANLAKNSPIDGWALDLAYALNPPAPPNNITASYFDYGADGKNPNDAAVLTWTLANYDLKYVALRDGTDPKKGGNVYFWIYTVTPEQFNSNNGHQEVVYFSEPLSDGGTKDISHIVFLGTRSSGSVPDGGATALLLGIGMLGVGFLARRKA